MRLGLIVAGLHVYCLVLQGFLEQYGLGAFAGVLPAGDVHIVLVVAGGLAVCGLVFFAEVCAAAFVAVEGIDGHHLGYHEEVLEAQSLFEFGVEVFGFAYDAQVAIEFLANFFDFLGSFYQALECTTHAHEVPHDVAQTLVYLVGGTWYP